jgi:hypothetical protein
VCQVAQYGKNSYATKETGGGVHEANNHGIPDTYLKDK